MEPRYFVALTFPSTVESIRPATTFLLETARMLQAAAADNGACSKRLLGVAIMRAVCPRVHTIWRSGCFGIELTLPLTSAEASTG